MKSAFFLFPILLGSCAGIAGELRVGIIGCDTSHVPEFTKLLNDPQSKGHVPGAKVIAAFKGGSKDIESSWSRVEGYTKTLQEKYEVRIYESIADMCADVDAVLLESLDGRPHLEQAKPVIKAHKPLFIDKPMAGSLHDVIEIFDLAKRDKVPVFSSSALRFGMATRAAQNGSLVGRITYVEAYGPCELEAHHPDLFWYGIHGVEALYAILGRGCESVQRGATTEGRIEATGNWSGGRVGIFREDKSFHGLARGDKGQTEAVSFDGYEPLVEEIVKFFQTGIAPVKPEETIEMFAFMEAVDESKRQGGTLVRISEVLKKQR